MSIRHAILGFLSWKPFTGYELKGIFADALSFHWSGNSNQIYTSLLELHRSGSVSLEVQQQEKYPARKVYTITDAGRAELREWLLSEPELPVFRSMAQIQLAWAACLSDVELDGLLASYERQLSDQAIMCRETIRRGIAGPDRGPRERLIWESINDNRAALYEAELAWTRDLRTRIKELAK
jgi:PadR family transcriptional regulator, regulatory protein AphA